MCMYAYNEGSSVKKKRHIDFLISDDEDSKTIFRFYPRRSTCHSFTDVPPTCWDEVYKVYFCYSIVKIYKNKEFAHKTLLAVECDECSEFLNVSEACRLISEGKTTQTIYHNDCEYVIDLFKEMHSLGMGTSWQIQKLKNGLYRLYMYTYIGTGLRLTMNAYSLKKFGNYLRECCEYMLAHGDPI